MTVYPVNGYSQSTIPAGPSISAAIQPAAAVSGAAGPSTSTKDVGLAPRENPFLAGTRPSRPNIALLETMQAARVASALLSSLMSPNDSFFHATLPATIAQGRMRMMPRVRSLDSRFDMTPQGYGVFANPLSALPSGQDTIGAARMPESWVRNSRAGHMAYLIQIQAQRHVDQWSMGTNSLREWSA
jgi:hypothetical protein